jgi:hypothetical protein
LKTEGDLDKISEQLSKLNTMRRTNRTGSIAEKEKKIKM